ncbi:MAG: penicillin-binding protein 2 [Pseudomonadota bacterium]
MRDGREDEARLRARFSRRLVLFGGVQAGLVGVLAHRLHALQILEGENYKLLSDSNRISMLPLAPTRGRIFDRAGQVLAANRDELVVQIIPDRAGDVGEVLTRLQTFLPIDDREIARVIDRARRQSRILPIALDAKLDWETLARINVAAPALPGVETEIRKRRVYAGGEDLGHILGYVGAIEEFRAGQDPALRLPGMKEGKSGVEAGLETTLRGKGGQVRHEVNARGQVVRQIARREATDGADVTLSINSALQARVMRHVARYKRASAVVMDVHTGEILAMASAPSFDPAEIVDGVSDKAWHAIESNPAKPLLNRAVQGQYPPGSTFKMVTALAALDAGLITTKERLRCSGSYEVANHKFGCWNRGGHGRVNLHRALRESCDVYFYRIAERVGMEKLAETARRFGFGEMPESGLAGEKPGIVPNQAWKLFTFERPWVPGETLLSGIGQGYVLATPLQLAVMTARLARGRLVTPTIRKIDRETHQPAAPLGYDETWLQTIRKAMFAVVNQRGGTGHRAALGWPGVHVAGKTGTSQVAKASRARRNRDLPFHLRDHSLFVGYAPYRNPKYAVAAIVDHGGGGGEAAAPLTRAIMQTVLSDPVASGRGRATTRSDQQARNAAVVSRRVVRQRRRARRRRNRR